MLKISGGLLTEVYSEVSSNPCLEEVDACADRIRTNSHDFVVVLGGGSAIDLAKAATGVSTVDKSIKVYHGTDIEMPESHLPLIAIRTTAGTGSEVTWVSVLTNYDTGEKARIVSKGFYPDYAIIDPLLTMSKSPYVTASTGIDVLAHAIEG